MIADIIADTFVDSNILIYVYDNDAKKKHEIAVVKKLLQTKMGIISTQVLQVVSGMERSGFPESNEVQ